MKKKGLVLLAFGTSMLDGYERSLKTLKTKCEEAFKECKVELVFTSEKIRNKIKEKHNIEIKSIDEVFEAFIAEGIEEVYLQPLNIFQGREDIALRDTMEKAKERQGFTKIALGTPLLPYNEEEFIKGLLSVMRDNGYDAVINKSQGQKSKKEGWVLMGHGSKVGDNGVFFNLQGTLLAMGYENIHIATLEGEPTIRTLLPKIIEKNYSKVNIMPILLTPGYHTLVDLSGDKETSWKNIFQKEKLAVRTINRGLGEYGYFHELYLKKIKILLT